MSEGRVVGEVERLQAELAMYREQFRRAEQDVTRLQDERERIHAALLEVVGCVCGNGVDCSHNWPAQGCCLRLSDMRRAGLLSPPEASEEAGT